MNEKIDVEAELENLIELLVKNNVITEEEMEALKSEYDWEELLARLKVRLAEK